MLDPALCYGRFTAEVELPASATELSTCENCWKPTESLTFLPGWNFKACPECAEQCRIMESVEDANGNPRCPVVFSAIYAASTAAEMRKAMQAHTGLECVHCASTRDAVPDERSIMHAPSAVCCGVAA